MIPPAPLTPLSVRGQRAVSTSTSLLTFAFLVRLIAVVSINTSKFRLEHHAYQSKTATDDCCSTVGVDENRLCVVPSSSDLQEARGM